jgi:hypothetical protein
VASCPLQNVYFHSGLGGLNETGRSFAFSIQWIYFSFSISTVFHLTLARLARYFTNGKTKDAGSTFVTSSFR